MIGIDFPIDASVDLHRLMSDWRFEVTSGQRQGTGGHEDFFAYVAERYPGERREPTPRSAPESYDEPLSRREKLYADRFLDEAISRGLKGDAARKCAAHLRADYAAWRAKTFTSGHAPDAIMKRMALLQGDKAKASPPARKLDPSAFWAKRTGTD